MSSVVKIRAFWGCKVCEVEYELEQGFEIFQLQLVSVLQIDQEAIRIINAFGIEIADDSELVCQIRQSIIAQLPFLDVWCVPTEFNELTSIGCTSLLLPSFSLAQPTCNVIDTNFRVCAFCASNVFHASVLQSGTGLSSGSLAIFSCESQSAIDFGFASEESIIFRSSKSDIFSKFIFPDCESPVALYLRKQLYQQALSQQRSVIDSFNNSNKSSANFKARLNSGYQTVKAYEDISQKRAALECINFSRIKDHAIDYIQSEVASTGRTPSKDIAFLHGLLRWFKNDFFQWCNQPECGNAMCGARPKSMQSIGMAEPTPEERNVMWAGRVEVYRCKECNGITRFPRINNPKELLKSRKGRCGEWANAFCLICRSLSLDARWVLDYTDHVWVEIYVPSLCGYVHADPCEKSLDCPLMYESGWNKKLSYILSFSRHGVVDATPKYTRKWNELLSRRNELPECYLSTTIAEFDSWIWTQYSASLPTAAAKVERVAITAETHFDLLESGLVGYLGLVQHSEIAIVDLMQRKQMLTNELKALLLLTKVVVKANEAKGRSSGDIAWRLARGEIDTNAAIGTEEEQTAVAAAVQARQFKHFLPTASDVMPWLTHSTHIGAAPIMPTNHRSQQTATKAAAEGHTHLDITVHSVGGEWQSGDVMGSRLSCINKTNTVTSHNTFNRGLITIGSSSPICVGGRGLHRVSIDATRAAIVDMSVDDLPFINNDSKDLTNHNSMRIEVATLMEYSETFSRHCKAQLCSTDSNISEFSLAQVGSMRDSDDHSLCCVLYTDCEGNKWNVNNLQITSNTSDNRPRTIKSRLYFFSPRAGIATTTALTTSELSSNNGNSMIYEFKRIPNYRCRLPTMILYPTDTVEEHTNYDRNTIRMQLEAKAQQLCYQSADVLGYVSVFSANTAAASAGDFILLFTSLGYPLHQSYSDDEYHCELYLKCPTASSVQDIDPDTCAGTVEGADTVAGTGTYTDRGTDTALPLAPSSSSSSSPASSASTSSSALTEKAIAPVGSNSSTSSISRSSSSASSSSSRCYRGVSAAATLQFVPMGGGFHGDTATFDTTQFLFHNPSMEKDGSDRDEYLSNNWLYLSTLRLSSIAIFTASDQQLCSGVRCSYASDYHYNNRASFPSIPSQAFVASDPHNLHCFEFIIPPSQAIAKVVIRAGALVDGIELVTSNGTVFAAGGQGGSAIEFVVPSDWRLIGFFGGIGGHLHNIGLVLLQTKLHQRNPISLSVASSTSSTLVLPAAPNDELTRKWASIRDYLLSCYDNGTSTASADRYGMMNYYQNCPCMVKHFDITTLLDIISNLIRNNPKESTVGCIKACALYAQNIVKNPTNPTQRKVKCTNNYFVKQISRTCGGIALFCFGPCGFALSANATSFEVIVQDVVLGQVGVVGMDPRWKRINHCAEAVVSRVWLDWLANYADMLNHIVTKL